MACPATANPRGGMGSVVRYREVRKHAFYVGRVRSFDLPEGALTPPPDQPIVFVRLLLRYQAKRSRDFETFAKIGAGIGGMQAAE